MGLDFGEEGIMIKVLSLVAFDSTSHYERKEQFIFNTDNICSLMNVKLNILLREGKKNNRSLCSAGRNNLLRQKK